jgi:hypothetical protein
VYRINQIDRTGEYTYSATLAITSQARQAELSAFPNPVDQSTTLTFNTVQNGTATFVLVDGSGRVVLQKVIEAVKGINTLTLNMAHLKPAVYTGNLNAPGTTGSLQVVKK